MYPPGTSATISQASRCRKHPALCDHSSTPVLVSAVPGGRLAQCLACGTLGPQYAKPPREHGRCFASGDRPGDQDRRTTKNKGAQGEKR